MNTIVNGVNEMYNIRRISRKFSFDTTRIKKLVCAAIKRPFEKVR